MRRQIRTRLLVMTILGAAALLRPPVLAASDDAGFSLSVLVQGAPAPEYAARGRIYVEALRGKEFTIRLYNPGPGRAAVALSVDGRNVVDAKRTSADDAAKWILEPGGTIEIPGWQVSGQTSRRFFFTETSRSYAKWLGDTSNVGTIEAVFYRERRPPSILGQVRPKDEAESDSRRSAPREAQAGAATPPTSKSTALRESDRFAATGIGERTSFPVSWVAFEHEDRAAATISVRYEYREQLVRLGVLPRDDRGLDAREHARGFEPAYAPDPGGRR